MDGYITASFQHVGSRFTQPSDQEDNPRVLRLGPAVRRGLGRRRHGVDLKLPSYDLSISASACRWTDGLDIIAYVNNLFDENALLSFDRERGGRARLGYAVGQPRTAWADGPQVVLGGGRGHAARACRPILFGLGQEIGVAVDHLPVAVLAAEDLGHAQVHLGRFVLAGEQDRGVLQPGPIGQVAAGLAVENLQAGLAAGRHAPGATRIDGGHVTGALLAPAARREEGGGIGLGGDLPIERAGVAVDIGLGAWRRWSRKAVKSSDRSWDPPASRPERVTAADVA
jgi:hypothetical protein